MRVLGQHRSHLAWTQVGWTRIDPTNRALTETDHVRVTICPNAVNATITSGAIVDVGGPGTLEVPSFAGPADGGR